MTVKEFVEEYNKSSKPEAFIKKHIVVDYVPYEEKITLCNKIVESSMYVNVDGRKIYRRNMPSRYMLFTMTIINKYTDIEINYDNLEEFNILEKTGLSDLIKINIPPREFESFDVLLKVCTEDDYENNRTIISKIDNSYMYYDLFTRLLSSIDKTQMSE